MSTDLLSAIEHGCIVSKEPIVWSFTGQLPPSVNSLYFNRKGGRGPTAIKQRYDEATGWELRAARAPRFPGRVSITIAAGLPNRLRDLDGLPKALLDCLVTNGVIVDDSYKYVRELNLRWDPTIETGKVFVTVRAM